MENTKIFITLKGELLYPRKEEGVRTFAIDLVNDNEVDKLKRLCVELEPRVEPIKIRKNKEGSKTRLVNVRSKYDITTIDMDDATTHYEHGAKVIVRCALTKVKTVYANKYNFVLYATHVLVMEHGEEKQSIGAKDIMKVYEGDGLPF